MATPVSAATAPSPGGRCALRSRHAPPRPSRARARREARAGYLLIAPALFIVGLFVLYPLGYGTYISFTNWPLLGPYHYVGTANYSALRHNSTFIRVDQVHAEVHGDRDRADPRDRVPARSLRPLQPFRLDVLPDLLLPAVHHRAHHPELPHLRRAPAGLRHGQRPALEARARRHRHALDCENGLCARGDLRHGHLVRLGADDDAPDGRDAEHPRAALRVGERRRRLVVAAGADDHDPPARSARSRSAS